MWLYCPNVADFILFQMPPHFFLSCFLEKQPTNEEWIVSEWVHHRLLKSGGGLEGDPKHFFHPFLKGFFGGRSCESEVLVTQLCQTLRLHGLYVASQAPLSMEFSGWEHRSGLPCPPPGDLPDPGNQTRVSCIAGRFFAIWATRERLGTLVGNSHLLYLKSISSRKKEKPQERSQFLISWSLFDPANLNRGCSWDP